jgi:hypothetical protein
MPVGSFGWTEVALAGTVIAGCATPSRYGVTV